MLYLISFGLKNESTAYEAFFAALDSLGDCVQVHEGAVLCYSPVSAAVIAAELRSHLSPADRLVVVQMYRGHCAGLLNEQQKRLVCRCISQDPYEVAVPPARRCASY